MKSGGPWNLRGLRPEARAAARDAARRSGMSVGEWLNTVIQPTEEEDDEAWWSADVDRDRMIRYEQSPRYDYPVRERHREAAAAAGVAPIASRMSRDDKAPATIMRRRDRQRGGLFAIGSASQQSRGGNDRIHDDEPRYRDHAAEDRLRQREPRHDQRYHDFRDDDRQYGYDRDAAEAPPRPRAG